MPHSVTVSKSALTQIELENAFSAAKRYASKSRSDNTWRAYRSDWRRFEAWTERAGLPCLPAETDTVAMFAASEADAGRSPSTITRRLAAIRLVHLGAGHDSPHNGIRVMEVMRGIRRSWAKPKQQKAPILDEEIRRLADAVKPETALGLRDRALLLFGFAGAFRRSELVALDVADIDRRDEGLLVTIRSSKTDQNAEGQTIAIPNKPESRYCPVQALEDWLTVAGIDDGAIFRRMFRGDKVGRQRLSAQSVALVIKELAFQIGMNPKALAGHSLRRGFLTSAARNRASIFKMADQSRHKSLDVLRSYVSDEERFVDNAGQGLLEE